MLWDESKKVVINTDEVPHSGRILLSKFNVFNNIPQPVFIFNTNKALIFNNKAAEDYAYSFFVFCSNSKEANNYFSAQLSPSDFIFRFKKQVFKCVMSYAEDDEYYVVVLNDITGIYFENKKKRDKIFFYEQVFNNVPVDLVIFDEQHRYVFVNRFAIKNDEVRKWIIGKNDFEYVKERGMAIEIAERRRAYFEKCVRDNATYEIEDETVGTGNNRRTTMRRFSPILNEEGKLLFILGFGIDITDRKNIELELQYSEKEYKALFYNNTAGVFKASTAGQILTNNTAFDSILENNESKHIQNLKDILSPKSTAAIALMLKGYKKVVNYEEDIILKSGRQKTVLVNLVVVDSKQEDQYLLGTVLDITDQKLTRVELERSEERYRFIFESSLDIIISVGNDGAIYFHSESFSKTLGFTKQEITYMPLKSYLTSQSNEKFQLVFDNVIQGRSATGIELEFVDSKGNIIVMEGNISPSKLSKDIDGVQAFFRDITQRRKQEITLKKSLEEKEILLKEVHHRVKNNLTVIYSLLELDAMKSDDEELKKIFASSQSRIRSMAMVHENLYQTNVFSQLNMVEYTQKLFNEISAIYINENQPVDFRLDSESIFVDIDQAISVGLILNELLVNFYKYVYPVKSNPRLILSYAVDFVTNEKGARVSYVQFNYSDNGPGVKPGVVAGTGIGMLLLQLLSKQLKAQMKTSSDEGCHISLRWEGGIEES